MLKKILIGAAAVMSVAGVSLATTTAAEAAPWGGYHGGYGGYHGGYGYRGGAVLGAGVLGLAVGASLANPYYGYGYGYAPGYYAPGYYAPGYYGYGGYRGYYGRGYYGHGGWHR